MYKVSYSKYELGKKVFKERFFKEEDLALDFAEKMHEKYKELVTVLDEVSNVLLLEIQL